MTAVEPERSRLLREISDLECAYHERRAARRPMPACVERAYRAALQVRYSELDTLLGQRPILSSKTTS